ncbi:MAG: hypothetical protein ABJ275_03270 [Maricaulaceae bacterium]
MPKKTLYHPGSLAEDLDVFLAELCEDWDFCAGVTGEQLVKTNALLTPKRFTDTVILAEGMKLADEANWVRRIKRRFVQRYGNEVNANKWNI